MGAGGKIAKPPSGKTGSLFFFKTGPVIFLFAMRRRMGSARLACDECAGARLQLGLFVWAAIAKCFWRDKLGAECQRNFPA
jgi:hypothetical protein